MCGRSKTHSGLWLIVALMWCAILALKYDSTFYWCLIFENSGVGINHQRVWNSKIEQLNFDADNLTYLHGNVAKGHYGVSTIVGSCWGCGIFIFAVRRKFQYAFVLIIAKFLLNIVVTVPITTPEVQCLRQLLCSNISVKVISIVRLFGVIYIYLCLTSATSILANSHKNKY